MLGDHSKAHTDRANSHPVFVTVAQHSISGRVNDSAEERMRAVDERLRMAGSLEHDDIRRQQSEQPFATFWKNANTEIGAVGPSALILLDLLFFRSSSVFSSNDSPVNADPISQTHSRRRMTAGVVFATQTTSSVTVRLVFSISDKSLRMIGTPLLFRPSSFAYENGECMVPYALITGDREEYGMLHWQIRIPLRPHHARETRANNAAPHNTHSESLVNLADRLVSDNTQYFQRSKTYRFLPTGRHSTIDIEFRGDELNVPEDRLYTSSRFTRNLCGGTCCPSRTTCLTER